MWEPYIYGAKTYFPKARHCHDHFHIVGYLNKMVDSVRKREVKRHKELRRTKYIWLKDKMNLTDKQQIMFDTINRSNYEVSRAWRIKENFREIQFKQDRPSVLCIYNFWRLDAKRANIPEMNKVIEMFDRHQNGILNAIQIGATNARAERLNGSIQELKTIGRGYRTVANFRTAILFFHGNLQLSPH